MMYRTSKRRIRDESYIGLLQASASARGIRQREDIVRVERLEVVGQRMSRVLKCPGSFTNTLVAV